jgi:ATP-dependent DNA ligase
MAFAIVFRDGEEVQIGSRRKRPTTRYSPSIENAPNHDFP